MDGGGDGVASGPEKKQKTLPEVPLQWTDFMWALEKLRHKPYSKRTRERDWFRINPLEMVLLGGQSVVSNSAARRENLTMVLSMGPLTEEMLRRPRYWLRLFSVLSSTIQCEEIPPIILQRCCSLLVPLWKRLQQTIPEFHPFVCGWCVKELNLIEVLERMLHLNRKSLGATNSAELQQWVGELEQLLASATESCQKLLSQRVLPSPPDVDVAMTSSNQETVLVLVGLRDALKIILEQCGGGFSKGDIPQIHIQVYAMYEDAASFELKLELGSLMELMSVIKEGVGDASNVPAAVAHLLAILQLLAVRWRESEPVPEVVAVDTPAHPTTTPVPVVRSFSLSGSHGSTGSVGGNGNSGQLRQDGGEEEEKLEEEEEEREKEGSQKELPPSPPIPTPQLLIEALTASLKKWSEMCEASATSHNAKTVHHSSSMAAKLFSLIHTVLSFSPLHESLPSAISFLDKPLSLLVAYSTEGYLSDSPGEFLEQLLEFITSLVEQGSSLDETLQTNLPNLFGPAFGIRSHAVSCKLLEFGYLAVVSQHKKILLTKGLRFLMEVFHLFPPLDQVMAEAKACALHAEALSASRLILEQLLAHVVPDHLNDSEEEQQSNDVCTDEVGGDDVESEELEGSGFPSLEPESDVIPPVVTDEMRQADKQSRLQVLLKLLQLACVMIRSGDDITFVFASTLPKLFRAPTTDAIIKFNKQKLQKFFGEEPPPPPSQITWKVDKKELAIQLLDLGALFVENDAASPFQLCGIVVPKLVKSLDEMTLSDEEKMSLTLEVLKVTREMLEAGHDVDDLISHGIDLIAILLPKTSNCQELRRFISQIASHLVTFNLSSMLFLIKNACQFMKNAFPDEVSDIQQLFKALLFRGKRDEIRGIFRVCKEPIRREQFVNIHRYLYDYAAGKLSHRQLIALCEVLIHAMDIEKPQKVVREIVTNVEEEEESLVEERSKLERAVMTRLASPSLQQLEAALQENRFKREVWEDVLVQLAQIALFRTLFQSEFASFSHLSKEQLLDMFKGKFPPDVLSSEDTMKLLSLSATRIEHMQVPRYDSLKLMLAGILRHFLTLDTSAAGVVTGTQAETAAVLSSSEGGEGGQKEGGGGGEFEEAGKSALRVRMARLERYIEQLPRNVEDRRKLMDHGYSQRLWDQEVSLSMKTDGSLSLEENMRQNLLACYTELVDILKQMAVTHVSVDGEMVKCAELFSDELSLADLKGRRAVAIRAIDQKRGGMPNEGHFYERKIALLTREDQIEADFEKMSKSAIKPKLFRVTLNTKFFDCARCCGAQIIGCYAPTGEHCERPLEIGLRVDSGIASIYDEAGLEIENAELLFTEEGAYLFKAYSNGHPYDTSQVWVALFTALLKEEESSSSSCPATGGPGPPLLPAIIIPAGYPNQRTWEALRRCVSTELTGSILTCRHDFSPEWRSYYDHRPERVRMGMDIVLHSGFSLTSDPARPVFQRQRSKFTKDLAGLIFEEAMQSLLEDEWLKQFKFLGKVMSQYISVYISEGVPKAAIISDGFNYERWRKTAAKNKQVPGELLERMPEKEAVVDQVVSFLDSGIVGWCEEIDLPSLCSSNHKQLLELKGFLERSRDFREKGTLKDKLKQLRGLLGDCMFTVPLLSLPDSLQEEIIHWVFRNEDRVWRYRGGRDGHETLQQFMNFLGREKAEPDHGGGSPHERATEGQEEGVRTEHDKGVRSSNEQRGDISMAMDKSRLGPNTYAGVVVFYVPIAAETDMDFKSLQVDQMVAYAVGEMSRHVPTAQDGEVESIGDHESENQQPNSSGGSIATSSGSSSSIIRRQSSTAVRCRRQRPPASCYEVVTAWVHPSYRGLGLSTQMYLQIVRQVPARLVVCDMMVGSVERIIGSSWLLGVLDQLRVLSLVVQRRQLSYNVTTQTGASEQFEQVLFNVRPMRLTLKIYDALRWCRANPGLTASLSLALPVAIVAALGTAITVKLLTR